MQFVALLVHQADRYRDGSLEGVALCIGECACLEVVVVRPVASIPQLTFRVEQGELRVEELWQEGQCDDSIVVQGCGVDELCRCLLTIIGSSRAKQYSDTSEFNYLKKFNWVTWSPPRYVLPIIFS